MAYQKLTHDFFLPPEIREDLQKKNEATRQVMPSKFAFPIQSNLLTTVDSQLPTLEHYHTLVPLDTNHNKNAAVFGFPSWVYKAISHKSGNVYALRRLEG